MKKITGMVAMMMLAGWGAQALAEDANSFSGWLFTLDRMKEVRAVDNEQYAEECGACHFAYPPGLLPSQSWHKLLAPEALADHFGENAELNDDVLAEIQQFAYTHAAEHSYYKRSRKIARATADGSAPLRITEVKYIKRKHHEIPTRMIKDNPDVQSLSNCNACHTQAEKGVFDNDTVNIPNYPDWDD